jgi:hypothetical protein
MNFNRLLNTNIGRMFISMLLGLGLATLFRRVCTDKNCISFNGPIIDTEDDKPYKFNGKCYKYSFEPDKCTDTKRIIPFATKPAED